MISRAFKAEGLRIVRWDYSVVPAGVPFLDVKNADLEVPVDVVLARAEDLIPVTVSVTLSDKEQRGKDRSTSVTTKSIEMLFYKHVSLAAVFRIALTSLYDGPSIFSRELEFLDPSQQPIDEPASLSLQQCITRCGFVELPAGMTSYPLSVNDGIPVTLTYVSGDISNKSTVVLPPSGSTVGELLNDAFTTMKLPGKMSDYFLSCKSGVALLDLTAKVERHHVVDGLMIANMEHLFSVTLNDTYMAGFMEDVRPNVASLVEALELSPDTQVCFNDTIVINNATSLVRDGLYYIVDEQNKNQFAVQEIMLPNGSKLSLPIAQTCTVGELLEVVTLMQNIPAATGEQSDPIPALIDSTDCILADNLTAADLPRTPIRFCFI